MEGFAVFMSSVFYKPTYSVYIWINFEIKFFYTITILFGEKCLNLFIFSGKLSSSVVCVFETIVLVRKTYCTKRKL